MEPERLWPYVHQEATDEERRAIEAAMRDDPSLLERVRRMKSTHSALGKLMACAEQTDEELARAVLQAWEENANKGTEESNRQLHGKQVPALWHVLLGYRFRVASVCALAAALVLMLVGVSYFRSGPVSWNNLEFVPARFRGDEDTMTARRYSREDAKMCQSALAKSIKHYYDSQKTTYGSRLPFSSAKRYSLTFVFQEIVDGQFRIDVKMYDQEETPINEWTGSYSDTRLFMREADRLGRQIATKLRERNVHTPEASHEKTK